MSIWLSIIIPVYNGGTMFKRCLESVQHVMADDVEIIIVADGEGDGAWRDSQSYDVLVKKIDGPCGPAIARNVGAQMASGDLLFFVDADVELHTDVVQRLRTIFANPDVDAVIGSYDDQPADANFLSQYRNLLHHYVHQTSSTDASTFWGACGAVRRKVFFAVGGFDEAYSKPSIEDIALGYALKIAGYQIQLDKRLLVKHLKTWTVADLIRTDLLRRAVPWTQLLLREGHFINDLNLKSSNRASVALAFTIVACFVLALFVPRLGLLVPMLLGTLLVLNLDVYDFFRKKRGLWFSVRVVPWHILYYLYSGFGFALGALIFYTNREQLIVSGRCRN